MALPSHARFVIIGAGIHGLSTAWQLAGELARRGQGADILVLDKSGIAAGASGIACGVIRNNYFQPAMRELMQHSVGVWESDPRAFSYHPVGYLQISHEGMREDVAGIHQQQRAIGYRSVFIEGQAAARAYMKDLFHDWRAQGITSVLHELQGGYANNAAAVYGLAGKAEALGVRIITGVTVTGFARDARGAVRRVETDRGAVDCEQVVIGVGPWIRQLWEMLELPATVTVQDADGIPHQGIPTWRYWCLEEGVLAVDPQLQKTNAGLPGPVIHVDTDAPLYSDEDGSLITAAPWGIYYKPDLNFKGIQGGAMPYPVEKQAEAVAVDPYGPASPEFIVGPDFAHFWVSALAFCQKRFSGLLERFSREPSGGLGCFTPDSFPVFDRFCDNVYIIADSNHGYKMIGVGQLVARELLGEPQALLEPFRFDRYEKGRLHPTSHSPFPWS